MEKKMKNKKQLIIIIAIFLALVGLYFFAWRFYINKSQKIINSFFSKENYETVKIGGFPFMKNITFTNLEFKQENKFLTKNKLILGSVNIKSVMFGSNYSIKISDAKYKVGDVMSNIEFNKEPQIEIAFYSDGKIKKALYNDEGYRIIDDKQKTIYKVDSMKFDLNSVKDGNKIDYATSMNVQNYNALISAVLNNNNTEITPDEYTIKLDLSSSIEENEENPDQSIFNLICNNCEFANMTKNFSYVIDTNVKTTKTDPLISGKFDLRIKNYNEATKLLRNNLETTIRNNASYLFNSKAEEKEIQNSINEVFSILNRVANLNTESNNNDKVFTIERNIGASDYTINGKSLYEILNNK